ITISPLSGEMRPVTSFIKDDLPHGEFTAAHIQTRILEGEHTTRGTAIGQCDIANIDGGGHETSPASSPTQAGDPVLTILCRSQDQDYWMCRLEGTRMEKLPLWLTACVRRPAADTRW